MKKTFYITQDAWDVLKDKPNKSRYVCDLIINDSEISRELLELREMHSELRRFINARQKETADTGENMGK